MNPRFLEAVMIDRSFQCKKYKLWDTAAGKIIVLSDVNFDESQNHPSYQDKSSFLKDSSQSNESSNDVDQTAKDQSKHLTSEIHQKAESSATCEDVNKVLEMRTLRTQLLVGHLELQRSTAAGGSTEEMMTYRSSQGTLQFQIVFLHLTGKLVISESTHFGSL